MVNDKKRTYSGVNAHAGFTIPLNLRIRGLRIRAPEEWASEVALLIGLSHSSS